MNTEENRHIAAAFENPELQLALPIRVFHPAETKTALVGAVSLLLFLLHIRESVADTLLQFCFGRRSTDVDLQ